MGTFKAFQKKRRELLSHMEMREEKLQNATKELKAHFVGLDDTIDEIIDHIRVWYVMPELLSRPVIVCLWGMTGVGKTDLVRRLVRLLDFNDQFLEMSMDIDDMSSFRYETSISGVLRYSSLEPDEAGIILFDEFQRYRTIDEKGLEVQDLKRFQDIWTLLSDGCFSNSGKGKNEIIELLMEALYHDDMKKHEEEKARKEAEAKAQADGESTTAVNVKVRRRRYGQSVYTARMLKRTLRLKDSLEDIMKWTTKQKMSVLYEALEDDSLSMGVDYSKTLIFIGGNLDEAFWMAQRAEDADTDADVLHKRSLGINMVQIREALKKRFHFEQIARLGNCHVIYPCLSSQAYRNLIAKRVQEEVGKLKEISGVHVDVGASIYKAIYRNGVFPAQGVRPVFSTITTIFSTSIPPLLMKALERDVQNIKIDFKNEKLVVKIGDKIFRKSVQCALDKIKKRTSQDKKVQISVHEAGHALIYMLCFGTVPCQVKSSLSNWEGGFVIPHELTWSLEQSISSIRVTLAGIAAETVVFGKNKMTSGGWRDVENATRTAARYFRAYGMGDSVARELPLSHVDAGSAVTNLDVSNEALAKLLDQERVVAIQQIKDNLPCLHAIADALIMRGEVGGRVLAKIVEPFIGKMECLGSDIILCEDYEALYRRAPIEEPIAAASDENDKNKDVR